MDATYDQLCEANADGEPTWRDVLAALREYDSADEFKRTVQEVDDEAEKISWLDRRDRQQETSFASFRGRLTKIKKSRR